MVISQIISTGQHVSQVFVFPLRAYSSIGNCPHHPGEMPEGTLRAILKEAGIDPNDFLKKK